jgi:predicted kinase
MSMRQQSLLIVLVGVPGSGKSTWASRNASEAVIVSQDDLIDAITPSGFQYSARPIYGAAEEAVARSALGLGRLVIIDRTNRTRSLRQRWLALAREANCPAVAIVMSADIETCRVRNNARNHRRKVCTERMERMISLFELPSLEEGFARIVTDVQCPTIEALFE